uniref:Geranylgeranyl diphosphate synthase n=2 Tax=Timema TaxID=61471 RepID=A0A7R9IH65_9NEOP|nr:unnamed protein product [Timema bartmani]CAD7458252.1 unnamed protein product [Timema tahoe]
MPAQFAPKIDDIEDNSILRRGIPVAHSIYGIASTINAANYVMFLAVEKAFALNHPEATRVYTEQLLELHRGQGMEIYWRDNYICPSEDEYKRMTKRNILRQRTRDLELKRYCITLLERFGSFAYTRNILQELDTDAREEIAKLGGNPLLEDILDQLLNWKGTGDVVKTPLGSDQGEKPETKVRGQDTVQEPLEVATKLNYNI